jgi:nucleotide-binding universal stress UspA family protein
MNGGAHLTAVGILVAVIFAGAMMGLIIWMFRLPPRVGPEVARARHSVGALRRIVVPVVSADYSRRGVELACRLGRDQKAEIVLLAVIEVPRTLPLGAYMPAAEKEAQQALDAAQEIVQLHGLEADVHIERARSAGAGILKVADDHEAHVIVLGIRPHVGLTQSILGRTTDFLLRRAPYEVLFDKPGEAEAPPPAASVTPTEREA